MQQSVIKYLAVVLVLALPSLARAYEADSLEHTLPVTDAVSGIWQVGGGGVVNIVRTGPDRYEIRNVHSIDTRIAPGTLLATAHTAGLQGALDASWLTMSDDCTLGPPYRRMLIKPGGPGQLVFEPYQTSPRINIVRLVPYLYRVSLLDPHTPPAGLQGAYRLYPPAGHPLDPIIL